MKNFIYSFNELNFKKIKFFFKLSDEKYQSLFNLVKTIIEDNNLKNYQLFANSEKKEIIAFDNLVIKFSNFIDISSNFARFYDGKLENIQDLFIDQYIFLFENKIKPKIVKDIFFDSFIIQYKVDNITDYDQNCNYLFNSKQWEALFKLNYNDTTIKNFYQQKDNFLFDYKFTNAGYLNNIPVIFDW